MIINLIEFLKNGVFGSITLGEHRNKIINLFNSIDELKNEDYISFNNLELKFFDDELVLISFYLNHTGELFLNDQSKNLFFIEDFQNFEKINLCDFEKLCEKYNLKITKKFSTSSETSMYLNNEIYVTFEDDVLNSISIFNVDKI